MIYILSITLRTLNDRNCGIFLIMGNAGFISSTVCSKSPYSVSKGVLRHRGSPVDTGPSTLYVLLKLLNLLMGSSRYIFKPQTSIHQKSQGPSTLAQKKANLFEL